MKSTPPPSLGPVSSMQMTELYRDEYACLLAERNGPIVRLVRSSVRFPSRAALEACYQGIVSALTQYGTAGRLFLSDMRAAPGRNDPWFEEAMREIRPRLFQGFARLSVLVSTQVGALQLERITKEDGLERLVSTDEAEVLDYLRSGASPRSMKRGGNSSR